MDDKQLLDAIRGIVREETKGIVAEQLSEQTGRLGERMARLEESNSGQIGRLEERMTRLEVSYENNTEKILKLLREDYSRVSAAAAKTGDYGEIKGMVRDHDRALANHNRRITDLEEKNAI